MGEIDAKDIFIWVNHSVQREGSEVFARTLRSLNESDAKGQFEVWTHDPKEQSQSDWLIDRLRQAASRAKFFIRLENDVVVNRYLCHNVASWSALSEPDFGLGLLYSNHTLVHGLARQHLARSKAGNLRRKTRWIEGGQAQLYKSELVEGIVANFAKEKKELSHAPWYSDHICMPDFWVSTAVYELGLSTYLMEPSLVQHIGTQSSMSPVDASGIYSRNFDQDWKSNGFNAPVRKRKTGKSGRLRLR